VTKTLGVGLLTGWGAGVAALPEDARRAAGARRIVPMARPAITGERFRRATRESLLGVAAVDAALRDSGLDRAAVAGSQTALVYVTAAAYGASNKNFIVATSGSPARAEGGLSETGSGSAPAPQRGGVYFPYTAPSAVPAEVAIEYGLTGGYVILVGGAVATVDALWQASVMLAAGRATLALVLAVETFEECADLWARGRWATPQPLVEAAACAVLAGQGEGVAYGPGEASTFETMAARRAGTTLACAPLVGLALARAAGMSSARVTGHWRGRRAQVVVAT
jgi:Beta-ketoacyl synthase, N-terminal domain